jgi:hypothetical protein
MDGRELARRMGELRPEARVLFTSGYAQDDVGGSLPGSRFLPKPYEPVVLTREVEALLR